MTSGRKAGDSLSISRKSPVVLTLREHEVTSKSMELFSMKWRGLCKICTMFTKKLSWITFITRTSRLLTQEETPTRFITSHTKSYCFSIRNTITLPILPFITTAIMIYLSSPNTLKTITCNTINKVTGTR